MRRWTLPAAIGLFLAIAWGGTSYVVGQRAEQVYHHLVDQASQFGFISVSNRSYQRGVLSSRAESLVKVKLPSRSRDLQEQAETELTDDGRSAELELILTHDIRHGPLPYSSGPASRFTFEPAIALVETHLSGLSAGNQDLPDVTGELAELREILAIAKIGWDGRVTSLAEVPPVDYATADLQVELAGLGVDLVADHDGTALAGRYQLREVSLRDSEGGRLSWEGLNGDFELTQVLPLLYVGSSRMEVGRMAMSIPAQDEKEEPGGFVMDGLTMVQNSTFDGSMVHAEQKVVFSGLAIGGEQYGPLEIEAAARNLDGRVLSAFQQRVIDIYRDADRLDSDVLAARVLPIYLDLFSGLLAARPELSINHVLLVTPHGKATGSLELQIESPESPADRTNRTFPEQLRQVVIRADVSADEALVLALLRAEAQSKLQQERTMARWADRETDLTAARIDTLAGQQAERQLKMYLEQNYLERAGGQLVATLTFRGGELLVNGQVIPILENSRSTPDRPEARD